MIHQQLRNTGSNIVALHIFDPEESMKKKKCEKCLKIILKVMILRSLTMMNR